MKRTFAFLFPAFFLLSTPYHSNHFIVPEDGDSTVIIHNQDGTTTEWPAERFETDKETNITYAVDNDAENLYVAMRITDQPEQMKMMRMGMRFFIDVKAKKKENMGIEFPVKRENAEGSGDGSRDPKAMRDAMMMNMIYMRIFGFEGQDDPKDQGLTMNNTANIAYTWDSTNVLSIEYRIPLKMIDKISNLNNKEITLGCKVNGMDFSSGGGTPGGSGGRGSFSARTAGRGNRSSGSGNAASDDARRENFEKMMKEQSVWTKYTFR